MLMTTAPMHGHFFPLVPLAWALQSAGHEVLVAAPGDFSAAVTGTGLCAHATVDEADFGDFMFRDRAGRPVERPAEMDGRLAVSGRAWGRLAARVLPGMLDAVRGWRPDLVISEPCEHAGPVAAARHGVPWVEHGWGMALHPILRRAGGEELAPELDELGLPALPDPSAVIDVCPPSMQRPGAAAGLAMRYTPYNGSAPLPGWLWDRPAVPRVCLTMGSLLPRFGGEPVADLLSRLVRALPALGIELVVAMAPDRAKLLPAASPAVRLAGWLPISRVLPHCDLVIHHGGGGSTLTSLAASVPQLVLPRPAVDMIDNAERVAAAGAGRALPPEVTGGDGGMDAVLAACAELLAEPRYRRGAAALAAEIAARPAPARIVPRLRRLAAAGPVLESNSDNAADAHSGNNGIHI
ncbi:nucleotide disphospho-sugar-binding domain-containing protein [Actinomadura formosensis]|uniref:nucleotide disphospho-sugar-binding domain-containing protein n=1 Tax=Actinomadura formosensis TaxID=60706 RepID=UPI001F5FE250|nr:nucleotide disphospho-sugar-binding domain-containing protein [Actinomadura formosensis]